MLSYFKEVLPGGARIVAEEVPYVRSVALGLWVKAGSRDEKEEQSGISHFIEHMLFKGTERRSARELAEALEAVGGQLNAFTTKEYTCYYIRVLDEHLDLGIDVLTDMFFNSRFDPTDVDTERNVILEEINMYEDSPDELIHDLFARTLWKNHPLGRPILGNGVIIKSLTREELYRYYKSKYIPQNVVISAAGRICWAELVDKLAPMFSASPITLPPTAEESPVSQAAIVNQEKDTEQVQICLGVPGLKQEDDRLYPLYILNNVLGGGVSSRLFQEIREQRGLAYSVYSYHTAYRDSGLFGIYAGTSPSNRDQVVDLIVQEIKKLCQEGISIEELRRSQEQIKGNLYLNLESVSNRMTRLGKSEICFNRIIGPEEIIARTSEVTREQVAQLAAELFVPARFVLTTIGPTKEPATLRL